MTMDEPSKTEKTVLKNLNNILNANKSYFDSLKFKLVTDHTARKHKKSQSNRNPTARENQAFV